MKHDFTTQNINIVSVPQRILWGGTIKCLESTAGQGLKPRLRRFLTLPANKNVTERVTNPSRRNFFNKLKIVTISSCLVGLVPVQADEPAIVTEVAVQTGKITQTTLQRYVLAYGVVEPEPASHGKPAASTKIAAPVAGIISQLYCEEGQRVKKDAPLFALDSRAADDQIAKANVALDFAQKNFARKQQLNPGETISRKLYDDAQQLLETARTDLQTAKTQRALLNVTAPLSGTITALHFRLGEAVSPSSVLADLVDLHRLVIVLHVPSPEAADLRLGQTVTIRTGNTRSQQTATVSYISPQIDPLTDTVLVRATPTATICGQTPCLRPGQSARVSIVVEARQNRLAVPVESVVTVDNTATIAIVEGDRAKQQAVTAGLRDGNLIEVSGDGLQAGMTVVTQGAYGLPPETRIRVLK
ncbi:MAG: efflux RND transporter periplasmic adaptor subunit [Methylovulum sp.]|uniref:efflux RND transporter periplasmic adaptor subunit n=1 Tax=Methylovulum sp. TaxID=1916980 RepID=UPI002633D38B|nr:efflux RND transporter periplasmic adaptor subunit [Methylovulum sp.]MDD2722644.1 efflux RND transporter periplasmic adaptor subunit [Methylovulum sp.]MDD5123884.1 efflux RND transporter periplasmic adaptor subunit [Methylovulum sp.]